MSELTSEARGELTALAHAYAAAIDARDGAALAALFTADGRLTSHVAPGEPRSFVGPDLTAVVAEVAGFTRTLHEVVRQHAVPDGAGARGDVACVAHHVSARDGEASDLVLTVQYDDEYRVDGGRWRIAVREVRLLASERRAVRLP